MLLLPWILCTAATTLIHITLSLYLFCDAVYCLLCVVSQYQEYVAGRGLPEQTIVVGTASSVRPHNPFPRRDPSKVPVTPLKDHLVATYSNSLRQEDSCTEDSSSKVNIYSETSCFSEEDQSVNPVHTYLSNSCPYHPDTAQSVSFPL
ncbi:uncharacterized protein LOC111083705 [Limulus polyphemus]|uniref:Uncharacterized protein LOC111083705 n=1 Tax=Limulus polyphemus TaxID=6850 RepID=A0ABM1RXG6_LIMPO|nr:uncharacterized protein LOC111083705 [Limulus polyphemus]